MTSYQVQVNMGDRWMSLWRGRSFAKAQKLQWWYAHNYRSEFRITVF